MNYPFTFHSGKDRRLVCLHIDEQGRVADIEAWNETQRSWAAIPEDALYESYIADFKNELSENAAIIQIESDAKKP